MIKKLLSITAIMSCVCIASVQAQTKSSSSQSAAGNAQAEKDPSVKIKLKVYRWSISNAIVLPDSDGDSHRGVTRNPIGELFFKKKDGTWGRVSMPSSGITSEFEYIGKPNLEFFIRTKNKGDDQYVYKSVGRVTLPFNTESIFLLMIQRGESARFFPMNVSPQILPKDKVAVLNMTKQVIGIDMGGKNSMLRAGGYSVYAPKKNDDLSSEFKIYKYEKEKWRPVYEGNITPNEEKRCMLLVFDPYGNVKYPKFSVQLVYF